MTINVRVRDGMCPDPTTGDGGATEGDIRGSFSDIIDVIGVKDLAGGHCLVTQNSPTAMSVLVAPGIVYIPNADYDELDSNQVRFWEAIVTVSTAVIITANTSGSARVDLICAKMDTAVTPDEHASNIATLVAVAGTPGAGAPATPDNHYVLATVAVANGASTIVNADITDSRVQSKINSDYIPLNLPSGIILSSPLFSGSLNGWINPNETWQFVSVDDPTGVFRVNADVTTKYSAGMRIKMTNGGNIIYGIITVVGSFSGGYTSITFLHQIDPTDSLALVLMANSAITLNYYSTQKAPFGFPLETNKWTVKFTATSDVTTNNPTKNTWYNICSLSIPIGSWNIGWGGVIGVISTDSKTGVRVSGTLSTANNSEVDTEMSVYQGLSGASGTIVCIAMVSIVPKNISLTSKTTYYLNYRTISESADIASLVTAYANTPLIIKAICAYL